MANFFPRWANWIPLKLLLIVLVLGAVVTGGIWYYFTPKYTNVGYMPDQPAPFSHAIHVEQLGMDCRYCHSYVEVAGHSNVSIAGQLGLSQRTVEHYRAQVMIKMEVASLAALVQAAAALAEPG